MDIVAERAARKAAKSEVQSSLKPSSVAGDEKGDEEEDEEDAIVKDEEYKEEEEEEKVSEEEEEADVKVKGNKCGRKGKGEVVMSKGKKIKVEDKEVGEKKRKKDSDLSSSEDEKTLKKKTKGRKKGKGPSTPTKKVLSDNQIKRKKFLKVVHVTAEKVHEILGLPLGGISLYDLPERREDDEFVQLWLSQFAPKKKKQIFATDIAEKLVRSTRVDFMFKVNFFMLFVNVMGKADTMRDFVNLSVVRRIREDTNIAGIDWCDFIHRCPAISHEPNTVSGFYNGPLCFLILLYLDSTKFDRFPIIRSRPAIKNWSTKNMSTRQYLEIEDEAFGKFKFYREWSKNETAEAEGFCEYASVLPHTKKRFIYSIFYTRSFMHFVSASVVNIICEMIEEKLSSISKEKAEVESLLRDANKEFPNDENVKQFFEHYKGFFKETVLLEEAKARKAPQNVKPKLTAVNTKEAAEKPKPAENVKELAEKPKEQAEKAQKAPQNVKPKPAAVKTKETAEKPKPAENVKELAEKPKEPAKKAQKAPQNPKEPAGDDYQVVRAATVIKAEDREEFEVGTFTQWIEGNIDWVGEDEFHAWPRVVEPVNMVQPSTPERVISSPSKEYVKPVKPVNSPNMCRRIDVTTHCMRIEFVLVKLFFNLWVVIVNYLRVCSRLSDPQQGISSQMDNQGIIKGTLTEEDQWKTFLDDIKAQFKYEPPSMSLFDFELVFFPICASDHFYDVVFNIKKPKTMVILDNSDSGYTYASKYKEACDHLKLFSRYLKEQNHSSHEAVAKMRPFIPKSKWRSSNNHVDCGVLEMIHMENYCLRYKIATKIMLHQFNVVSNKMFDFAFTFETKNTEQARVSMIVDAIKNRNNRDPPKQVKETDAANVVIGVNEAVDQLMVEVMIVVDSSCFTDSGNFSDGSS
nr:peptidase C48, SUMO/sentrin/Ubl1 [Tanacetum cinerariifolium]